MEIGRQHARNFDAGHFPSGGAAQRVLTELRKLAKHMASPATTTATPVRSALDDIRARRAARLADVQDRDHPGLLHEPGEATRQLERASQDKHDRLSVRSVRSPDRKGRVWGLAERLNEDDVHKIVMSYEAGELRRDIATRYKISVRSVGRLLRKWRAERENVA